MKLHTRFGFRAAAAVAGIALLATACTTDADDDGGDDDTDTDTAAAVACGEDDLVWVHEQEPPNLHLDSPANGQAIASYIRQSLWEGLYGISGDIAYFPELLAGEMEVTEEDDGTVTYSGELREGLVWSDGEPLTAEDVVGTYDVFMEGYDFESGDGGVYEFGSRVSDGYPRIIEGSMEATSELGFSWQMEGFFAGYKALFSELLPVHVLTDAATANALIPDFMDGDDPLPSSGPMVFEGWDKGTRMRLATNESYHGSAAPDVENTGPATVPGVCINFVSDTTTQVNSLLGGEADFIFAQPQLEFEDQIANDDRFEVAASPGPTWELWGFNLFNVHLQDFEVRRAIATAMDKSQVMAGLYTPLFGDALPANGLGNAYWMATQPAYEDHAAEVGFGMGDIATAITILEGAGYTLDDQGVMTHPDRGELRLRVGTTGGNQLRERQQELLKDKFSEAGIAIEIENEPDTAWFGVITSQPHRQCIAGNPDGEPVENPVLDEEGNDTGEVEEIVTDCGTWDLTQHGLAGGPWPGGTHSSFLCGAGFNVFGFCMDSYDERAAECDATIDDAARAACYNELDRIVVQGTDDGEGLVVMPLTQKPTFFAYSTERLSRAGVVPDANDAGPLVNVVDYQR